MRRRPAARLLVLDGEGRLLLFKFHFRDGPLAGTVFWATPGGEADPGESFEAAAIRELQEETGLVIADPGPEVGRREFELQLPDGERVQADERYFLVRAARFDLSSEGWTELEQSVLADHRWWALEDIRTAKVRIWPEGVAEMVEAAFADPSPAQSGNPRGNPPNGASP